MPSFCQCLRESAIEHPVKAWSTVTECIVSMILAEKMDSDSIDALATKPLNVPLRVTKILEDALITAIH